MPSKKAAALLQNLRQYLVEGLTPKQLQKLRLVELRLLSSGERQATLQTLLTEQRGFVLRSLSLQEKSELLFAMNNDTLTAILGPLFDARPRLLAYLHLPRPPLRADEDPPTAVLELLESLSPAALVMALAGEELWKR